MQEVLLLSLSYDFDVLVLLEVGVFDSADLHQLFSKYRIFFQEGENGHGGIIMMTRSVMKVKRVECPIPNACFLDIELDSNIRIGGVYGSDSRSWEWQELSQWCVGNCVLFGGFNVDIYLDKKKAEDFLVWADSCALSPFLPNSPTSLRSEKIIDFVLSTEIHVQVQTHESGTASDHKPIIAFIPIQSKVVKEGRNFHSKVFSFFLSVVASFWEGRWNLDLLDETYYDYVKFLSLLSARCTTYFPVEQYRIMIPKEMRASLSLIRALSFRQKRTGDLDLLERVKFLRNAARKEVKSFLKSQFQFCLSQRHSDSPVSIAFWSKAKRFFKSSAASLKAFILPNGRVVEDPMSMVEVAANHYEEMLKEPSDFYRPHSLIDFPPNELNTFEEDIPPVSVEEILEVIKKCKKKKSCDPHGLSSHLFNFIPVSYWSVMVKIFNHSFTTATIPAAWKQARIVILAKKESICAPSDTRPISLLDVFLKVSERLFTNRFRDLLNRRGLLPDSQSGFRPGFRLQTRVLLFIDHLSSLMANSSPVSTVFVDYKSAFDNLWIAGCLGKLRSMGIPSSYVNWIKSWIENRTAFIEIEGVRSRWFRIGRGGPQGSCFSPTLFLTYHADMENFIGECTPFFSADDLAAVLAGRIGVKFTDQCIDLERRLRKFLDNLEFYSLLTLQPINYKKTEAMWSSRSPRHPVIDLRCGSESVRWVDNFKYLGYWISPRLDWGLMIKKTSLKIRERVNMIKRFRLNGFTSFDLRKTMFMSFVLPLFVSLFPIYPLFTRRQQEDMSHLYYTCLKRLSFHLEWADPLYSFALNEISLEDRIASYWEKYWIALSNSVDGFLLLERTNWNAFRNMWRFNNYPIKCLHRSKRFVQNCSLLEKCTRWCADNATLDSIPIFREDEIECLCLFPEIFL